MRDFINMHSRDAILVAEASGPPHVVESFFEGKERMHMMFNLPLPLHSPKKAKSKGLQTKG
ncbi:hypothetical protein JAO76_06095 [Pontibacter sp. BT310]|uniref:Uncharacterized protein n=1 Tax=Pontibacter populi TaxID=890055 RepID=A0ABS6X9A5_9BACT|nr:MULTISPECIES: hypothetical protein [Pontibacter]MBJ6117751.1 hypothetical protein [Pontibacter sp. BT310]MBR0570177.1 hypothetical protein [Microvirga sp. STS03]MBW3364603.1 hypothetical protein [Pontibacter populi]